LIREVIRGTAACRATANNQDVTFCFRHSVYNLLIPRTQASSDAYPKQLPV
jgi:hypothetical protein